MSANELIDQIIALKTAEKNWQAAQQWITVLRRLTDRSPDSPERLEKEHYGNKS